MKRLLNILFVFCALLTEGQQLYVADGGILHIAPGANLEVTGDLENDGTILNTGTMSLYGNWFVNNIFNGNTGTIQFLGGQDQMVSPPSILVNALTMNQSGEVLFTGDEFIVTDDIAFLNGVIRTADNTRFLLTSDVRVVGGSVASYFQGRLSYQGSGIRKFPMGYEGVYAPITLLEVFGSTPEFTVSYQNPNSSQPIPGDELLGVSGNGIWEVQLSAGTIDPTPVQIDFSGEDLQNFGLFNNIRHRVNSPVIAVSDAPDGVFAPLGVETLLNSDSLSFGSITSEIDFAPAESQTAYFAIGLGPRIDPAGLVYIPEIFSPAATDPDNQTFRVFGERILDDDFLMEVYNRFGALVYSTESFQEANELGWDGVNQNTGNEEQSGLFYYYVRLTRINGEVEVRQGPFYLQR